MLRKIVISTKFSLVHSKLFSYRSKKKLSAEEEIFLQLEFLFAKYKVELTKISAFIISRRSLSTVLICWSCCQNHLFVSDPLPPIVFSIFDQEVGGETKQKNIWYVSSTTNCFYKENIDIIYWFTGVYRKDKTLTILSQVILFVFVSQVFPWPSDVGSAPQLFNYFVK